MKRIRLYLQVAFETHVNALVTTAQFSIPGEGSAQNDTPESESTTKKTDFSHILVENRVPELKFRLLLYIIRFVCVSVCLTGIKLSYYI